MRKRRLIHALLFAVILGTVPYVVAGGWSSSCSSSTNKVCIYRDDNWALPVAAMNGSKDNYNDGATYPNSASLVDNSANGSKNWYSSYDVNHYNSAYYQNYSMCTNTNSGWQTIGVFNNDNWSSHLLVSTSAC